MPPRRTINYGWPQIGREAGIHQGWPRGVQHPYPPLWDMTWARGHIIGPAEYYNERNRWMVQFAWLSAPSVARSMNLLPTDRRVIASVISQHKENTRDNINELNSDIESDMLLGVDVTDLVSDRTRNYRRFRFLTSLENNLNVGPYIQSVNRWMQRNPNFTMP